MGELAFRHQYGVIKFHNHMLPRVTFLLSWAYEHLAEMFSQIDDQKALSKSMALYRQVTAMFGILFGPTHSYSQIVQDRWQASLQRLNEQAAAYKKKKHKQKYQKKYSGTIRTIAPKCF